MAGKSGGDMTEVGEVSRDNMDCSVDAGILSITGHARQAFEIIPRRRSSNVV